MVGYLKFVYLLPIRLLTVAGVFNWAAVFCCL